MNKFSAHRITRASLLKSYILGTLPRNSAGALQHTLIIHLGHAMLLALWWLVRHEFLGIHLAPVHLCAGEALRAPSMHTERLMTSNPGQASTSRLTSPK